MIAAFYFCRRKKDYSRPLNFVASQSANDEDNEDSDKEVESHSSMTNVMFLFPY